MMNNWREILSWKIIEKLDVDYWLNYEDKVDRWYSDAFMATEDAVDTWNEESDYPVSAEEYKKVEKFAQEFIAEYSKVSVGILHAYITQSL